MAERAEQRAEAPVRDDRRAMGKTRAWGMYRSMWTCAGWGPNCAGSMSRPTVTMRLTGSSRSPAMMAAKMAGCLLNAVPSVA